MIKFRHLSENEIIVANELIKRKFQNAKKIECDVPLESEKARFLTENSPYARMWKYLTAKKIDLVVHLPDCIYIVEIKEKLSASAFGQLKLYEYLYKLQYKPKLPIKLMHAAFYDDPDVREFLQKNGVEVFTLRSFF